MMQYLNNESENTNIDKWLEMAKNFFDAQALYFY